MFGKPGKPYLSLTGTASCNFGACELPAWETENAPNPPGFQGMIYGYIVFCTI